MSYYKLGMKMALVSTAVVASVISLGGGVSLAAHVKPHVSTGRAHHILPTSAQLTAVVTPNGVETSYCFQWGLTSAYGAQTPTAPAGAGTAKLQVGQAIGGLQPGATYHFRAIAIYGAGLTVLGRDRTFVAKGNALKFEIPKIPQVTVGTPFTLGGTLAGLGGANHAVVLQATPYPYTEAFTTIAAPGLTNSAGRFSFRVANLATSTAFRVITLDPRPVYSPMVTVHAAVNVVLRVRSTGHIGRVRVYGTVTPATVGSPILLQLRKAKRPSSRPGASEATTRFATQFAGVVKKGGHSFSRFSMVVDVRHTGRYRVYVKLPTGALVSGASSTVILHAAPGSTRKKR
jgi:hypothetical protein